MSQELEITKEDHLPQTSNENRSATISKEMQAKVMVAKRFPRDLFAAEKNIQFMCSKIKFADGATYQLPRGEQTVTGPSVHLLKGIAQAYQNLEHGAIIEDRGIDYTSGFAYGWDYENNLYIKKSFYVKHERYTKKGIKKITDTAAIDEIVNARISRNVRGCLTEIIPWVIIEEAQEACAATVKAEMAKTPIEKRRIQSKEHFSKMGVDDESLKNKLGKTFDELDEEDLLTLRKVANAIKDKFITVENWLGIETPEQDQKTTDLNDAIRSASESAK